jgi:S1-C subfamily serine protease
MAVPETRDPSPSDEGEPEAVDTIDPGPERKPLKLLPTSLLGLASLVFFMGLASAFTGAVLYAYYESRLEKQEQELQLFIDTFTDQVDGARAEIQADGDAALAQIDDQLCEHQQGAAGGATLQALLDGVKPSVWFVSTLDETGAPSVGSAFVVFSDSEQSYLLTSYEVVRAATAEPAPDVVLRQGDQEVVATVFTWDDARDLALLALPLGCQPALAFVADPNSVETGDRVFAISGLGATGASVAQGVVADAAANAIQHDTPLGAAFRGGPLVGSDGTVVGVSSRRYAPLGFDPLAVFFAPPIRIACEVVITCPGDAAAPPG